MAIPSSKVSDNDLKWHMCLESRNKLAYELQVLFREDKRSTQEATANTSTKLLIVKIRLSFCGKEAPFCDLTQRQRKFGNYTG